MLSLLSVWLGILAILLPYSRHQVRLETQAINAAIVSILSAPADIEISTVATAVLSILESTQVDRDVASALLSATNRDELRTVLRDRARIVSTNSSTALEHRLIEAAVLIAVAAAMMIFLITRIVSLSEAFRKLLDQLHVVFGAFDRSATKRSSILQEENKETWKETREIMHRSNAILHELDFDNELLSILQRQVDLEATLRILFPMLGPYLPCERLAVAFVDQFGEVVAETAVTTAHEPKIGPGYSMQISKTSLQTVFRECRVRIIGDLEQYYNETGSETTGLILEEGFRSSLTIPLIFGQRCIGFLFLNAHAKNAYQGFHIPVAERFGASLAGPMYHHYLVQLLLAESSKTFVKAMEHRDNETGDHINRMSLYSAAVARRLVGRPGYDEYLGPRERRELLWYSPLHDIGKVGIPDVVLLKPGPLDKEERRIVETHVEIGLQIIGSLDESLSRYLPRHPFGTALDIVGGHHERWDGSGYPFGKRETEIPVSARIVAAADILDALTTKRPYKEAWSFDKAYSHMAGLAGTHLDPAVFAALVECRTEIESIAREP
ncbi:MAG: hypothetical protein A2Y38_21240 [Spirochaetes bacterium GWB1_59_5]|nr:MAG: hypothetical protein A2Y38_21240 [Spirochaetes bacterium GWB1_59_5]